MISTSKKAFTLLELILVILIISILSIVSYSKFESVVLKSKDEQNKANLSLLREALRIYYFDNNTYPVDNLSSLSPKYISKIPEISLKNHPSSSSVIIVSSTNDIKDSGMWAYVGISSSPSFGSIFIDCTHTTSYGYKYYNW